MWIACGLRCNGRALVYGFSFDGRISAGVPVASGNGVNGLSAAVTAVVASS